jgi:hypothetical protein
MSPIPELIKKRTSFLASNFIKKLPGSCFNLKKKEQLFRTPCLPSNIYAFVGNQYKQRGNDSFCGYFIEFPNQENEKEGVVVTFFEITSSDNEENKCFDKHHLFIDILPIFPYDYGENRLIEENNLYNFYFNPFRILE